jgi:hypothetical protein
MGILSRSQFFDRTGPAICHLPTGPDLPSIKLGIFRLDRRGHLIFRLDRRGPSRTGRLIYQIFYTRRGALKTTTRNENGCLSSCSAIAARIAIAASSVPSNYPCAVLVTISCLRRITTSWHNQKFADRIGHECGSAADDVRPRDIYNGITNQSGWPY